MARPALMMPVAKRERVGRYPKHIFNIREKPFSAQPFMIAPVLPGETLKNLKFEARCVADPIKNPLIGWKKEFHFFYVPISHLDLAGVKEMFVDPANTDLTLTASAGATVQWSYTGKGGIDWMSLCMAPIMRHWFRDEGEEMGDFVMADGVPKVQIKDTFFMDTLTDKDLMPEGAEIADATTAGDLDRLQDAFEMMRSLGLAEMTYEDWLRSQGINIPGSEDNRPERIAAFTDFQYPVNTVDPTSGAPSSAVSWVFNNGTRDPKIFKEPGFLVGLSITRPKIYFAGLQGYAAGWMGRAWDWMPNYLASMPETSLKYFAGDTGPLGDRTTPPDAYWLDMRDLLLYGDQFQNHTAFAAIPAAVGAYNMVALPDGATFNTKYPAEADIDALFKTDGVEYVRTDGYTSLSILGSQRDFTLGNFAPA